MCKEFQICVLLHYAQLIIEKRFRNFVLLSTTELARHHLFNFVKLCQESFVLCAADLLSHQRRQLSARNLIPISVTR